MDSILTPPAVPLVTPPSVIIPPGVSSAPLPLVTPPGVSSIPPPSSPPLETEGVVCQYISDIHLDVKSWYQIPRDPKAEVLIIAGDLGKPFEDNFVNFLLEESQPRLINSDDGYVNHQYEIILFVAGNHEFYSSSRTKEEIEHRLVALELIIPKFRYLSHSTSFVYYRGVYFVGTTLWSDVPSPGERSGSFIETGMSDYRHIKKKGSLKKVPVGLKDVLGWFLVELAYLEKQLDHIFHNLEATRVVVITHHAPSFRSCEYFHADKTSEKLKIIEYDRAYASPLDAFVARWPILRWVHGHIHSSFEYQIENTTICCSPVGYPYEFTSDYRRSSFRV